MTDWFCRLHEKGRSGIPPRSLKWEIYFKKSRGKNYTFSVPFDISVAYPDRDD